MPVDFPSYMNLDELFGVQPEIPYQPAPRPKRPAARTFLDDLAIGLRNMQVPAVNFGTGALSGFAQGFSGGRLADMLNEQRQYEQDTERANTEDDRRFRATTAARALRTHQIERLQDAAREDAKSAREMALKAPLTPQQRQENAYRDRLGQLKAERELPDPNKPGPQPTNPQERAATFWQRASSATRNATGGGLEDRMASNGAALMGLSAPNLMLSADQQKYKQAINDFALAFLRKESGATILPSEFEYVHRTFFAYPGDKPATLAQKRQSRQTALEGIRREGAPALGPTDKDRPVPATWQEVTE